VIAATRVVDSDDAEGEHRPTPPTEAGPRRSDGDRSGGHGRRGHRRRGLTPPHAVDWFGPGEAGRARGPRMAIDWSDNIVLAQLSDEPALSDELAG
jgi:hypothetical protein